MYQAFYLQMQYAMIPNDDDDMCSANDRQQIIRPLSEEHMNLESELGRKYGTEEELARNKGDLYLDRP